MKLAWQGANGKASARGHVFGGLRSSIRSGGSKPYRAGSYRLTRQSPGLSGCARHALEPPLVVCIGRKYGFQRGGGWVQRSFALQPLPLRARQGGEALLSRLVSSQAAAYSSRLGSLGTGACAGAAGLAVRVSGRYRQAETRRLRCARRIARDRWRYAACGDARPV